MTDVIDDGQNELTEQDQKQLDDVKAEETVKQETLETETEKKLETVFGDSTPEPDESTSEESDKTKDVKTDKSEESDDSTSEKTDESESSDKSTSDTSEEKSDDKTDEEDKKPAEDENTLSQAEIRAALHNNWKQEDLDELAKVNPGLAKRTCAKLLEGTNNLSKKFAEFGRKTQEAAAKPKEEKPESKIELKSVNMEQIRKDYKDDPIVDVVANMEANQKILVDRFNELGSASVSAAESEAVAKAEKATVAEDAAISQQIDTFFTSPNIANYKEFYGEVPKDSKDWDKLTGEQMQNRWKVVEEANMILLGAEQQGMEMALDEAFERAHFLATEKIREQVIRDDIKSSVKKREAGFSLKPSSSKPSTDSKGQKTGTQFQTDVGQRLNKMFRS